MAEAIKFKDKYIDPTGIGSKDRQGLFNLIYPVGSIYLSVNATSPAALFGGTWEQIAGRFLLGAGAGYTAGDAGGEATHTLTISEMPAHNHGVRIYTNAGTLGGCIYYNQDGSRNYPTAAAVIKGTGYDWQSSPKCAGSGVGDPGGSADKTGYSQAHNNMPPFLVVYIWKRTA